jgi:hypothetical protein
MLAQRILQERRGEKINLIVAKAMRQAQIVPAIVATGEGAL